jgi:hypothetical protein
MSCMDTKGLLSLEKAKAVAVPIPDPAPDFTVTLSLQSLAFLYLHQSPSTLSLPPDIIGRAFSGDAAGVESKAE